MNQPKGECVIFAGYKRPDGYGQLHVNGVKRYAHRIAYELKFGQIPVGLELDHLCRNPSCVNADHLEAVTHRENILRGESLMAKEAKRTACPAGHPYSPTNTRRWGGLRYCKQCGRDFKRTRYSDARARGLTPAQARSWAVVLLSFLLSAVAIAQTSTPTDTPTPTETATPIPPTNTPTRTFTPSNTATRTPTNTFTPSNTRTNTPTRTPTFTPSITMTPTAQPLSLGPLIALVVPSGGTLSNELALNPGQTASVTLYTPSTVEATGSVETSSDNGTTWKTLQKDGTDVAVVASKAIPLPPVNGTRLRIKQGAAAASRAYVVAGVSR